MEKGKRKLSVNCGVACLLNDRENTLDNYDQIAINSGTVILSSAINAKLSAKMAKINCGDLLVKDVTGEIIQLDEGTVIGKDSNFKGLFVIATGNLLLTKEGVASLVEAEGVIALETLFYPESADIVSLMKKVSGEKRAYPDDAQAFMESQTLEKIVSNLKGDRKHIWISGRLTGLEKKAFDTIKSRGFTITCHELFTYEGLNAEFETLINCPDRILVHDGFEIVEKINEGQLGLYGKRLYVNGKFCINSDDIPALEALEAIIVKGKAYMPSNAVKIFKEKGKADDYFIYEGRYVEINGFEQFSHNRLGSSINRGEKLSIQVNVTLLFDEDVTPEDIECIASISYNGQVLVSGPAKTALAQKVKTGNGFMGDPSIAEAKKGKASEDGSKAGDVEETKINMGTYILT